MKDALNIAQKIYDIINVTAVKSLILGNIYIGASDSTLSNLTDSIVINTNFVNTNEDGLLGDGVVNILYYCKNTQSKTPNLTKLRTVGQAILAEIESFRKNKSTNLFIVNVQTGIESVFAQQNLSYYLIRLKIKI